MTKKLLSVLTAFLIVALLCASCASAETIKHYLSNGKVYLRTGPGTSYSTKGTVTNGEKVSIVKEGSIWTKVKSKETGDVGYVKNLYISGIGSMYASGTTYYSDTKSGVTTASVNFRVGASTSAAKLGTFKSGTVLTVVGYNGDFYLVKNSKDELGFVHSKYLKTGSSNSSSTAKKTTTAYVNMRKGGGTSYKVLQVVPKGAKVTVITRGNYWTKCTYKGITGWIRNTYLK